jgi:hypothetical protein
VILYNQVVVVVREQLDKQANPQELLKLETVAMAYTIIIEPDPM